MKKRGVSPVVSTVLLIVLVIVIAVILFIWARGFITEQVEKFPDEDIKISCQTIALEVEKTAGSASEGKLTLSLVNNGNIPVYNVVIKKYSGFSTETQNYQKEEGTLVDIGRSKTIDVSVGAETKKIGVIPVLLGTLKGGNKNKEYVCYENEMPIET